MALHLFEEGAILLFLDVPENTEFGIDMYSWNVGVKFRGLKMIPPGIHFVYYSAVSKDGQTAPRTGFFHSFKKKEFVVKRWDAYAEDISDEPVSEEEASGLRANVRDLDEFLGPYPYATWKKWMSLTNNITEAVLERMQPLNKKVCSVSQLVLDDTKPMEADNERVRRLRHDDEEEERLLPKMVHKPGTSLRFVSIPDEYPAGSSAADITRYNLDASYFLDRLLGNYVDEEEILGDMQLAFVSFLLGHVYDAFEYWKRLVRVMCTSDRALAQRPELFKKMIFALYHQVRETPQDFFIDIVSRQNFLTTTLHAFFMNLQANAEDVDPELVTKGTRFQKYLTKRFRWDFQSEPDEYAPVVVDIPAN